MIRKWQQIINQKIRIGVIAAVAFFAFWQILPSTLFDDPYSFVLTSREDHLLGATIAGDGQWRFPLLEEVPGPFEKSLLAFEDKRFYHHPGIDLLALGRALYQNVQAGHIKSGGSTLTMQTIRLMRKNQPRTIWEKVKECFLALRLEMSHSKQEILKLYASHAPFGGNVVGLEAASWRYFNREPGQLSWSEAACLAVLPNSPSLVRPGKNQLVLEEKRNRLLNRLAERGNIREENVDLFQLEPLPGHPHPLPQVAPHLLQRAKREHQDASRITSTIDRGIQQQVNQLLQRHQDRLEENGVNNAAALITEVETGEVVAYAGNVLGIEDRYSPDVDVITARRSSGSVLKPILYTAMLQKGELLPSTLMPDVPTYFGNFHPQNFTERYLGAVQAKAAIALSLNVPSVLMLNDHGIPVFHHELKKLGMTTLDQPPHHYGLSLILGGAEVTPWDLTGMYATLARTLKYFNETQHYSPANHHPPEYVAHDQEPTNQQKKPLSWDAGAIYKAFEAMVNVRRPEEEAAWAHFGSSQTIAWKTGTSFGSRDAWAIGITPKYVVTVWAGNADGEGRSGVSGLESAAPVLFDLFNFLPRSEWFEEPHEALYQVATCSKSGYRAGPHCQESAMEKVSRRGRTSAICPFHRQVFLSEDKERRVFRHCYEGAVKDTSWFALPSDMAHYYKQWHPQYASLPPYHSACQDRGEDDELAILYPRQGSTIQIPKELDGKQGQMIAQATSGQEGALYWHLDESYLGQTRAPHQIALNPGNGQHELIVENISGQRQKVTFEVMSQ